MNVYVSDIVTAAIAFPLAAFVITLPYLLYQYRKYGSVPLLRSLVVYSFVFYLICAYFLVLLPLPADHNAIVPYAQVPQLVPFNFVHEFLAETSARLDDPSTWLAAVRDPYVYEAVFNVLLLVPLGMYVRYYFRRTWWQTMIIGFLVTLSFETLQLTGLLGLYAHPYRLFDVDDLMMNTLGAMVGYWAIGPALRVLPDIRLVNEEAREAGVRAGAVRRALSFALDAAITGLVTAGAAAAGSAAGGLQLAPIAFAVCALAVFVAVPAATHGQTPGQVLLKLRIVRPDASPASWYQYLARYGLLFLFALVPVAALEAVLDAGANAGTEHGAVVSFVAQYEGYFIIGWAVLMCLWVGTLAVRAVSAARHKRPFVMLNGVVSNTRVLTVEGVIRERERRTALSVAQVAELEALIAEDGTPLSELMQRAGTAVADAVRRHRPDPVSVTVLAGAGNNGGDGWVAAFELAKAGYPVTLITPDLAENMTAEPARSTALSVFAQANERKLPLRVLVDPPREQVENALDAAKAVVDAVLGTGFAGDQLREPYATWIEIANRRRFFGTRMGTRGRHRKRTSVRGAHELGGRSRQPRAKNAPLTVAVDVPSGLSAQTGHAASPCVCADITVTMLAYKPGLTVPGAERATGLVQLAKLVDTTPYLAQLQA